MPMNLNIKVTFLGLLGLGLCLWQFQAPKVQKNLLIQNATIIDGSGADRFIGSVRITDGEISEIGELAVSDNDSIIDATGLILSPGFIDSHSHHDGDRSRESEAAISQGITTIIVGQDGFSSKSIKSYFDSLALAPWSVNIGSFVGHNTLRSEVMGTDFKREATVDEINAMKERVATAMQNGALGLATGLEYDPGIYSNTHELIELAEVAAQYGGTYISHMRSEDLHLKESIREILKIGEEAHIPVQISHFKLGRKGLWGQAANILQTLDSARVKGILATADVYPYEYWQSTMTVLFPKRDFDNRASAEFAITELTTPEGMIISRFDARPEYEGMTLDQIASLRQEDAVTTYIALIKMSQARPGESIIAKSMDLEDIKTLLNWPHTNLCSDGSATGHPRGWGAFPRYLSMDTGQSLEAKIQKMTAQAAKNLGLEGIGLVKQGFSADLVLFDPYTVADKATYEKNDARAVGIEKVIVSGKLVYDQGRPTRIYPGRAIKKTK
ncbi:MAG: D-aminoacylase [Candidatus Aminicenantes bacterium]|nr:MAG: D-aminoacylase [Candidatus Aminicenantes bacterium]